ncbi:MAG: hypothetical protein LAP21_15190 [Acidobacteriia bacterium]|nr:hypothetical protein [Terriglobia bacterium]
MSTTTVTPRARTGATPEQLLAQTLNRHRELILQREYQPLGVIDFIFVQRGRELVPIDYRKDGPRIAWNGDTGDLLCLSNWLGLPDRKLAIGDPCKACMATCGDCKGKGKKPCTLTNCAGSGWIKAKFVLCSECLGGPGKKTIPDCWACNGRGEVPEAFKCEGCDDKGLAKCARCDGAGQVPTGREKGRVDGYDEKSNSFVTAPTCKKCNGQGRQVKTEPQPWQAFVNGQLQVDGQIMIAIGPIRRIVWHTLGENAQFKSCEINPDQGGNLMVLLLESQTAKPLCRQYLVGGVPQI